MHPFLELKHACTLQISHFVLDFHSPLEGACCVLIPPISLLENHHILQKIRWFKIGKPFFNLRKTTILLQNHASSTNSYRVELSVNISQFNEFSPWKCSTFNSIPIISILLSNKRCINLFYHNLETENKGLCIIKELPK